MKLKSLTIGLLTVAMAQAAAAQTASLTADGIEPLLQRLAQVIEAGEASDYLSLVTSSADRSQALAFANDEIQPGVTRAVALERFRTALADAPEAAGYRLMVEVFIEQGPRGRFATWQLDVRRADPDPTTGDRPWQIADQEVLDTIDGLYHLALTSTKQYDARNLVVLAEDLELTLVEGVVFVAETDDGITALVLRGRGEMTFSPAPAAERGQVEIFSGDETLETSFRNAFIRFNPGVLGSHLSTTGLLERPADQVDQGELRRAERVFDEFVGLSYSLDLGDLSDEEWSLTPRSGDFLAEVRTRRFETLTYTQSGNRPEDIMLYDRESQRVISLYASRSKLASRGRYYGDGDLVSYDVLDYRIESSFEPAGTAQESLQDRPYLIGCWIEGRARLSIKVTAFFLTTLTLRLADELQVHSVTTPQFGSLLHFRLIGRDSVIVSFPEAVPIGTELTLVLTYSGLLRAQDLEEAWIGVARPAFGAVTRFGVQEPRYVYSNRSYWYPQSTVTDYATATLQLTVPADFNVVASGDPTVESMTILPGTADTAAKEYAFITLQPARYLSCLISRFVPTPPSRQVTLGSAGIRREERRSQPGVFYDSLALTVKANVRNRDSVPDLTERAADILGFYASLIGDFPYPTLTLTVTDSRLPGGHSPAYFVVLNEPMPAAFTGLMRSWRSDPVSFSDYPSFFLAHELAHQWWGHAVGPQNYHERWLSEGLAQYFAALYAQHEGGDDMFSDVLKQMHQWALRHSREGPIYLGYRLGHIEDETRVFRALVYNKAAMVLHMLRRLIGDDEFFGGLRRFYEARRFQKAGTDDLQRAFEAETETSLERFFERWIHGAELPRLRFSYRVEQPPAGSDAAGGLGVILRFEQEEEIFDVPVTVTLNYRSGAAEDIVVLVTDEITELRVPLAGQLRSVDVNRDRAALARISD